MECRICYDQEPMDNLITPCHCKGSIAYVHRKCLERWINQEGMTQCDLCNCKFETICTRRYTLYESIRLWVTNRHNRVFDLILFVVLSFMMFKVITVVFHGAELYLNSDPII